MQMTGYLSREYALSLGEFGEPVRLPRSGGWILCRQIPGTDLVDGMSIYPYMSCLDWKGLADDVNELATQGLVSLMIVTDPFCTLTKDTLSDIFPDHLIHFKNHFINDLEREGVTVLSKKTRYHARKAHKTMKLEKIEDPKAIVGEWIELYENLISRYEIKDLRGFSPKFHRDQASVPGAIYYKASINDRPVGMQIRLVQGDVCHCHLSAYNSKGYDLRAAYALQANLIRDLSGKVKWLNLGGGTGRPDENCGLAQFKQRWASTIRPSYLCGRILNQTAYRILSSKIADSETYYFPAYRSGEFG